MHCRSFQASRLSLWVVIAIAIVVANLSADAAADAAASRLAIEHRGTSAGRPIVFIPGLASPGTVWDATAENFINSYDLHIVNLAGFGGLPPVNPIGPYLELAVAALVGYLDAQQLQDVVLVGHSLGGQISLQLAAARPDAVTQVLVVDSAPFFAALFNPAITPEAAKQYGTNLATQMAATPPQQFLAFARQGIAVQSISQSGQEQVMGYMSTADQATVAQAMGEVAGSDYRSVLANVHSSVTVLVAWSEGNPYSSKQLLAIYEGQYAGLDAVKVHIVTGSRHFIMLDQPDAFVDALTQMLADDQLERKG
ncbi:MAG: alpha/beta hydrolase [Gammaproteobacteria bacterium]|nr:MAG: alpha/beta hydrolase [Gammaproteobacteria bacterium]